MVAHTVPAKPPPKQGKNRREMHVETVQSEHFGASFHKETHFTSTSKNDLSYICFLSYVTLDNFVLFTLSGKLDL